VSFFFSPIGHQNHVSTCVTLLSFGKEKDMFLRYTKEKIKEKAEEPRKEAKVLEEENREE
jgi:hypothetical protein